jgi:hypothetical protein
MIFFNVQKQCLVVSSITKEFQQRVLSLKLLTDQRFNYKRREVEVMEQVWIIIPVFFLGKKIRVLKTIRALLP